jgi:hypothetical protein
MKPANRQAVILALTILSGLAGASLASAFLNVGTGTAVFIVDIGAAVGAAVAYLLLTADSPVTRTLPPPIRPNDQSLWRPPPAQSQLPQQPPQPAPPRPSQLTVPLAGGNAPSGGRQWWTERNSTATPRDGAMAVTDAPPLSSYRPQDALIAQCPRCGDFRIDAVRQGGDYAFRCRNERCANTWTWTPGTPWPAVVVRRNLT